MRALEPDVFDAVWAAVEPLLPAPTKTHPLGCHRRRIVAPFASASKCRVLDPHVTHRAGSDR